jgi:peptidoglycan hydrolase CwlO-like protein
MHRATPKIHRTTQKYTEQQKIHRTTQKYIEQHKQSIKQHKKCIEQHKKICSACAVLGPIFTILKKIMIIF